MGREGSGGVEGTPGVVHEVMRVAGGPLSSRAAGDPGRPVVVLLHGAMFDESRFVWDQLFGRLAAHARVVAIDLPRHGASRPWAGHLDHDRLVAILDEAFDHLGLTPPGQSWQAVEDGSIEKGGRCPMNMSGGLIGLGHPVGATGARMLLDCARQVTGQARAAQIPDARRMQALNIGGSFGTVVSFVVERGEPA